MNKEGMNLNEQPARPISFSPAMVEAINSGRKSQTRRGVNMLKDEIQNATWGYTMFTPPDHISVRGIHANGQYGESFVKRPFGKPGDLLWIREEHKITTEGWFWRCEFKDGTVITKETSEIPPDTLARLKKRKTLGKWQRARFLPRYFARTYLKVTDIRVERLQDISEEDAKAEGAQAMALDDLGNTWKTYRRGFQSIWESINGPGSWEANPWVWVVAFCDAPKRR